MTDTTVTMEGPELVQTKRLDQSGRLYLGKDYGNYKVRIAVEVLEEADNTEPKPDESEPDGDNTEPDKDDSDESSSSWMNTVDN